MREIILKTAGKENENGADTRRHLRILKFLARNPGTVRVSTENSKAKAISRRCAIFRPATAVFRFKPFGFLDTDEALVICGYYSAFQKF
jgi:hypothetical protein